jgi:hypothetical protein
MTELYGEGWGEGTGLKDRHNELNNTRTKKKAYAIQRGAFKALQAHSSTICHK